MRNEREREEGRLTLARKEVGRRGMGEELDPLAGWLSPGVRQEEDLA